MTWVITIVLASTVAAVFAFLFVGPALAGRAQAKRRRSASANELARDVQQVIRLEGWRQDPAADAIVERSDWTDQELLDALEAMCTSLTAADRRTGRAGRNSHHFELYDSGIAAMLVTLRARLGIPQPWAGRRSDLSTEIEVEKDKEA
jgi:hypothetical protein